MNNLIVHMADGREVVVSKQASVESIPLDVFLRMIVEHHDYFTGRAA